MAKQKLFSFAHLIGRGASASEEDESKKSKAKKAEDDDKEKDDPDADNGEGDDDKDKDSKAKGSDDNPEDPDAEDDPDAEEGDDDGEDDDDNKDVKKGRRAERQRCAAIFGSKHAAKNQALAASLAFNTAMSSKDAINVMATSGSVSVASPPRRQSLDERMRGNSPHIGPDATNAEKGTPQALAGSMTSLYNKMKGKK